MSDQIQRHMTPYNPNDGKKRMRATGGTSPIKFTHRPGSGGAHGLNHWRSLLHGSRKERAEKLAAARASRSLDEQIALLDTRLGAGWGAVKERLRLQQMKDGTYVAKPSQKKNAPAQVSVPEDTNVYDVEILSVNQQTNEYAHTVAKKFEKTGIKVKVVDDNIKIGHKLRHTKANIVAIVGIKEVQVGQVTVRSGTGENKVEVQHSIDGFVKFCKESAKPE